MRGVISEIVEVCPHCMTENTCKIARDEILTQVAGKLVCRECGEMMLACSECTERHCEDQPDCFEFRGEQ